MCMKFCWMIFVLSSSLLIYPLNVMNMRVRVRQHCWRRQWRAQQRQRSPRWPAPRASGSPAEWRERRQERSPWCGGPPRRCRWWLLSHPGMSCSWKLTTLTKCWKCSFLCSDVLFLLSPWREPDSVFWHTQLGHFLPDKFQECCCWSSSQRRQECPCHAGA